VTDGAALQQGMEVKVEFIKMAPSCIKRRPA
jgi:hypothetical protein